MACIPEIKTETDGKYQICCGIIKIIIDYLQVNKVVSLDSAVLDCTIESFPWMIFTEFIDFIY